MMLEIKTLAQVRLPKILFLNVSSRQTIIDQISA